MLFIGQSSSFSQPFNFKIEDETYFNFLNAHPGYQLYDPNEKLIKFQFYPNRNAKLSFLNTSNEQFALPNGTGAVYKLSKTQPKIFERFDSTIFHGYNNNAIHFIYKDTIYSLGGYGLWHSNGQLRYFNTKKAEWELKPIDQFLPITSDDIVDIRMRRGIVYTYIKKMDAEGLKQQKEKLIDSIYALNIVNGEVKKIGKATEQFKQIPKMPISLFSNYGALLISSQALILLDFEKNEIKKWENIKIGDLFLSGLGSFRPMIQNDSIIYFFNNTSLDSLVIPLNKMKVIGSIYTNEDRFIFKENFDSQMLYIIIIIMLLSILIYIIFKQRKNQIKTNENQKEANSIITPLNKETPKNQFSNIEIELIQLLLNQLEDGEKLNVESLNAILGVTKKSTDVQRKQRSQMIASINIKAREMLNINEDLIVRIKSEADSRIVSYSILKKYVDRLKVYI
jgi:hypothetical protein